jgi:hypothetical protein
VDNTEKFEPESEPHGTATLFRSILSAVVKSLYCILAKSLLLVIPILPAHSIAL